MSINNGIFPNPMTSGWPLLLNQYPNYAAFVNFVNGQFTGQTQWNWQMFDSLYRTSWVAERCVSVMADDMTEKWRVFEHDDPDVVKKRQDFEDENEISSIIHEAVLSARLYGGSAILPILHSQFNDEHFKEPFDPQSVKKNDLHGFHVLTKYDLTPVAGINRDIFRSPKVFGDYIYYKIIRIQTMIDASVDKVTEEPVNSMNLPTIHTTRMVKFYGKQLLYYQKFFSGGWGDSILVPILNKIPAIEESFYLMFLYLDLFNIDEIKIPNLSAIIDSSAGAQLFEKYKVFRDKMRSSKLRFMDSNDEMNRNQLTSLQNIVPVFQSQIQFCVGATGIPITRMLGTSVGGWSTGDNELTQYYDLVAQEQQKIKYQLRVIDEIIERSLFGKKMDIKYRFVPKREMTEKERAEINQIKANTFQTYMQHRVMTPQVVAQNIQKDYEGMDANYILSLEEDFLDYGGDETTQTDDNAEGTYGPGESDEKGDRGVFDEVPEKSKKEEKEAEGQDPDINVQDGDDQD